MTDAEMPTGAMLKAWRNDAGVSLAGMIKREAFLTKGYMSQIENGKKPVSPEIVAAYDRALGGDEVKRRALLSLATAGAISPATMIEVIRHGLVTGHGNDWDAIVADYARRFLVDPSAVYGEGLVSELAVVRALINDGQQSSDLYRAAASLAHYYGLWLGNQADLGNAHRWYRSSISLADASGDAEVRTYTRGRSLARGIYEGYSVRQTLDGAAEVLAMTRRPTVGKLEAHSARVHVYALTREAAKGREAVKGMADVASALPADSGATERVAFVNAYAECRYGNLSEAEAAVSKALPMLRDRPMWLAETNVYRGRAMVAAGHIEDGLSHALATVTELRHDVRVIGVAVRDVVTAVPGDYRSDALETLRGYADPNPGPWETLR
ncbi:hypothetical protein Lfu02_17330 [Longispora fulva]|uniref:Transcriptional regulator with XRE-family HTH domain n=1 Tax=Longispora fulva TaxID=619741 RepID=A0A8J7GM47_9ACTN|nr:helix-turn-helix transcriptional regulator [Longispora fulva]MBG6140260.1 transcriptional regulator with XRE-family HTH domain [Longispora fulva]GIG57361.1 hypothetical protein Lfu02_17330 [Longispora fulva]